MPTQHVFLCQVVNTWHVVDSLVGLHSLDQSEADWSITPVNVPVTVLFLGQVKVEGEFCNLFNHIVMRPACHHDHPICFICCLLWVFFLITFFTACKPVRVIRCIAKVACNFWLFLLWGVLLLHRGQICRRYGYIFRSRALRGRLLLVICVFSPFSCLILHENFVFLIALSFLRLRNWLWLWFRVFWIGCFFFYNRWRLIIFCNVSEFTLIFPCFCVAVPLPNKLSKCIYHLKL